MSETHRLAHDVVIDHVRGHFTIDGHEFPYWIGEAGPRIDPRRGGLMVVHVPLMADNVRVVTADGVQDYPSPWASPDVEPYDTGTPIPVGLPATPPVERP